MKKTVKWFLGMSVFVTLSLYIIPFGSLIAYPLLLLSTMVHEMAHGLTAILVGGKFYSFQMWPDGSGLALIGGYSLGIPSALVAAGGLVGPAVAASIGFMLAKRESLARSTFFILASFLIVCEILWVRNLFGILFVGGLALIYYWLARQKSAQLAQAALVFFSLQLSLSVFSRADYLFTPTALTSEGHMPSDVAQISEALFLPYWFWGFICAAFSVFVLFLGLRSAFKQESKSLSSNQLNPKISP